MFFSVSSAQFRGRRAFANKQSLISFQRQRARLRPLLRQHTHTSPSTPKPAKPGAGANQQIVDCVTCLVAATKLRPLCRFEQESIAAGQYCVVFCVLDPDGDAIRKRTPIETAGEFMYAFQANYSRKEIEQLFEEKDRGSCKNPGMKKGRSDTTCI